jgi:hypothetical protein
MDEKHYKVERWKFTSFPDKENYVVLKLHFRWEKQNTFKILMWKHLRK